MFARSSRVVRSPSDAATVWARGGWTRLGTAKHNKQRSIGELGISKIRIGKTLTRSCHVVRIDVALVTDDHDQNHDDSQNETGDARG